MADDFYSLAQMVTLNDGNLADINVSDLLTDAPLLQRLHAVPSSNGTLHKYLKETGAPTVGFRAVNAGLEYDCDEDTLVTVTLKILGASVREDKALADSYKDGGDAFMLRRAKRNLKAAFFALEKQILYGTGEAAAGFAGLADNTGLDAVADDMVIDAEGSTTAISTSCWLIRTGEDDLSVVGGNDGNIEIGEQQIIEATVSAKYFPAYYVPIEGYFGAQVGSARSVGRITNLTTDSGKGLTDDLISDALSLFPASRPPNVIAMSRRSRQQLQASRTATNATGAPAPFPMEAFGIDIVTTDSIGDDDDLTT